MKVPIKVLAQRMGCSIDYAREAVAQGKIECAFCIKRKNRREFYVDADKLNDIFPEH